MLTVFVPVTTSDKGTGTANVLQLRIALSGNGQATECGWPLTL
jgi:hypothetical protein